MALAEPEGYVRVFIDEGPPMAALLKLAAKERSAPAYLRRLLPPSWHCRTDGRRRAAADRAAQRTGARGPALLESDLDGPDIARELSVSLATVRTHTRNIYAKLGVNSRRAAVRRAAELGLLSRTRDRRPAA